MRICDLHFFGNGGFVCLTSGANDREGGHDSYDNSRRRTRPAMAMSAGCGQTIGLYKDWPMSNGGIIPYAPTAIEALAKRKG